MGGAIGIEDAQTLPLGYGASRNGRAHAGFQCCVVVNDVATIPPLRGPLIPRGKPALRRRAQEKAGPLRSG